MVARLREGLDPRTKAEIDEGFAELAEHLRANPLRRYNNAVLAPEKVHRKQLAFHRYRRMVKVFVGGNRAGKTACGACDDLIQCIDAEAVPGHLAEFKIFEPPTYGRIITVDFKQTLQAVQEEIRKWCPPDQLKGGSWDAAYRKEDRKLEFANGSFIEFLSQEQDRDQHGGTSRHFVHWDEEPAGEKGKELREENQMRLLEFKGYELFTFTNLNGLGWVFDEFEENKGDEVEPDVWLNASLVVVRADMEENPILDKAEIERRLAAMPPRVRAARKEGKFSHFKGLVYEEFDREIHIAPPPKKEHVASLECIEAIDPGVDTTAVVFVAIDKRNCFLVYDELYLHNQDAIPENVAERIRQKRNRWRVRPAFTLIDPSAVNRDLVKQDTVAMAFHRAGISTLKAKNARENGVFEVMRRLSNVTDGEPDPLILISEDCPEITKEFRKYRRKPTKDGSFEAIGTRHALDCLRYVCSARPLPVPDSAPTNSRPIYQPGTAPPRRDRRREPVGPLGEYA